jgi:hypothetical protein
LKITDSRPTEYESLRDWLDEAVSRRGTALIGLSGPGGIGKSYLLNSALEQHRLSDEGYCRINVDGRDRAILGDFIKVIDLLFAPVRLENIESAHDYFPRTRQLIRKYRALEKAVEKGLQQDKTLSPGIRECVTVLLKSGAWVNRVSSKTREWIDFDKIAKSADPEMLEKSWAVVDSVQRSIQGSSPSALPGPIQDLIGATYGRRLRTDLFGLLAEEYVADLHAALSGYRRRDILRLTHPRIPDRHALLLILDDFEVLGKVVAEFVVANLLPALNNAAFPTIAIVVGRDDMQDAHIGFQHHHAGKIIGSQRLQKLPRDVATRMFIEAGYTAVEAARKTEETEGYPFLVATLCESKERTVTFYRRFFDRTTRWMSEQEKAWVIPLAYLDRITEESIAVMLPDTNAKQVMAWFTTEASIRDPEASWFVISPFIRNMLLEYNLRLVGESRHAELQKQAGAFGCSR